MIRGFVSEGKSDPGPVRERNEDVFIERPEIGLWAVADGAGGYGSGDVAAAAIAEALARLPEGLSLDDLVAQVHRSIGAVHDALQDHAGPHGTGRILASTVIVLLAHGERVQCLWAGDSRAYLLRAGVLTRLTRDHSLVQALVDQGLLDPESALQHPQSHIVTRAVGAGGPLELDEVSARAAPGDLYLLCSDGLYGALSESEIVHCLATGGGAEELVHAAVAAGARDNVTAVTVRAVG